MRKSQKSQAEHTIDLMDTALGEIRKALEVYYGQYGAD